LTLKVAALTAMPPGVTTSILPVLGGHPKPASDGHLKTGQL